MSDETKRPATSLRNFLEIRLDRNKNVNNENKSCVFFNDKITLHEQNAQKLRNEVIKYRKIKKNYEKLLKKSLKYSY